MLTAPFPYFGGKRRASSIVWDALGDCSPYVEPFFGSGALLLGRPHEPGIETVNDIDGLLVHFWRAVRAAPAEVARHADYPVSEIDLYARHRDLVRRAGEVKAKLEDDPRWYDAELAGWWVWGASQWLGGGWCAARPDPHRRRPDVTGTGAGVKRKMPCASGSGAAGVVAQSLDSAALSAWFAALSARLRRVRILCGDFARALSTSVLYTTGSGVAGVFLDPPYAHDGRAVGLYAHDLADASARAREWALAHGDDPRLRIVLAGYEGEHAMPSSWRCVAWRGPPGLGRVSGNRERERLWLSPHCLRSIQLNIFEGAS